MDRQTVADSRPLPPGCRFHPSEEQLLSYYLLKKNSNDDEDNGRNGFGFDVIKDLDVHKYNPFNLPEVWSYCYGYQGRKRHWYGYCVRVLKGERILWRSVEGGFWKRKRGVREVVVGGGGGVVLGSRVSFVFYLGDCVEDAVRTNWYMHEYALVDVDPKAFVLCRVFVKFRHRCASKASEHALCERKNVSAVRHIGVQHDETVKSDIEGPKECDIKSVDRGIQTSSISSGKVKEEEDDDMNNPGMVSALLPHFHPVGSSMTEHEKSSVGLTIQDYMSSDDLSAQELNCILEGDYLELNDLLSPLPENDGT